MIVAPAGSTAADEPRRSVPGPLAIALWSLAAAILAGWLALAWAHTADDYRVSHLQGVWMAVAEAARAGRLYPPIFDGEHYAGTRYMPLPILLNALAAGGFDDPLVGGKVLAALLMAMLLALVVVALRRAACPWPISAALAATVVATDAGLQAGTTIGGDLLPVVLQTGALAIVAHGCGRRHLLAAGMLAGLAAASKLTGVWGFLAIATWLLLARQWRPAAVFSGASAATAAVILGVVQLVSRGGFSEHLLAFSFAGVQSAGSWARGPNQLLYNLLDHASAAVVLLPLAALGALLPGESRRVSLFHLALAYVLLLLMVVYADVGSGFNQLLELIVVAALAVGELVGRVIVTEDARTASVLLRAVVLAVLWAGGVDLVRTVGFDVRRTVPAVIEGRSPARPALSVAEMVQPQEEVLAEDPSVYVALRRQPVVMDPFMLRRLEQLHPQWVDPLISRIEARRFDLVVLAVSLDDRNLDYWWRDFHFGARVADALRGAYRADGTRGRFFLYRPLR